VPGISTKLPARWALNYLFTAKTAECCAEEGKGRRCAAGRYAATLKSRVLLNSFVGLYAMHMADTQDATKAAYKLGRPAKAKND